MSNDQISFSGSTANGTIMSPELSRVYNSHYIAIKFYSDEALTTLVTPTAGTATFEASEDGDIFGTVLNGAVTANLVGPAVMYNRPNWSGFTRFARVTFLGVTGGAFFKAIVAGYEG